MILQSERLTIESLDYDDADFIIALMNTPGWLRYIGDRNMHDHPAARAYIDDQRQYNEKAPMGMYAIRLNNTGDVIGICGILQRDYLQVPDIGFALLPEYHRRGYAREACHMLMDFYWSQGRGQLLGITSPDNIASQQLLLTLGFERSTEVVSSRDLAIFEIHKRYKG